MTAPVKSADRVLQILELLTDHPAGLSLAEVQDAIKIPKSSAYGLLTTMTKRGFLALDPDTRKFRVGIRLWQAGRSYLSAESVEEIAKPYMERVRNRLNETVQLAILDGADNVYIGKVDPDHQLRLASHIGARLPAYATGIGKALLSQLTDEDVRLRYADIGFQPFTPTTLPDVEALLAELNRVRERGYAIDRGEYTEGVFCIAYPLRQRRDGVAAAISVSIPEVRKTDQAIADTVDALGEAARDISQRYE